jgi:hypothetical protein
MPGPDIWGPHGWKFIHYITLGYPSRPTEEERNKYFKFFTSLSEVIPCSVCGNHFKQHLELTPLDDEALSSRDELMKWAISMHNHVNARNGKKIYSVRNAIKAILENDDKCLVLEDDKNPLHKNKQLKKQSKEQFENTNNTTTLILSISIIINILLILYLLFKK